MATPIVRAAAVLPGDIITAPGHPHYLRHPVTITGHRDGPRRPDGRPTRLLDYKAGSRSGAIECDPDENPLRYLETQAGAA